VTPEAVIYRYLEAATRRPVAVDQLVTLIAADADLLGRWLNLLACPAEPESLAEKISALSPEQLRTLAQAQAWAVLPVAGSARLGMDQWQAVLRSAYLAEVLAEQLGLKDPEAVRWRVLLAVSGVNLEHDPEARELAEFRGVRQELLQDAGIQIKVFAVVDALEVLDEFRAAQLAERLLDVGAENFGELVEWAGGRVSELTDGLDLNVDLDADWAHRLWMQQQVAMLSELLGLGHRLVDLGLGHRFASRSLFHQVPLLLYRDARNGLTALGFPDVRIALDSPVSRIAEAVREGELRNVTDSAETAVADRQLLRRLNAEEALCVPLIVQTRAVGALLFQVDEDVDYELPLALYAEQLAQRLDQLESRPDEGLELLKRYRQREEKRLREIVHEVNNPLSVVYNYLHILELRLQHEPSAREQVQMIGSELKRAGEILQRVRDLPPVAEMESAGEVSFSEVDVNDLARRVFELHRGYAEDHDVELQLELCHGALVIATDEQRLAQVLNNLTRNAIEASAEETVCIGSSFGVFREGREGVELFVRDTGPGLPREVLERLAEPKESTKGGDHAGLGLHIVHRLVGELRGGIDVRTAAGVGTTFTIFLPLKPL
jgi:signal transduction histidine kinase